MQRRCCRRRRRVARTSAFRRGAARRRLCIAGRRQLRAATRIHIIAPATQQLDRRLDLKVQNHLPHKAKHDVRISVSQISGVVVDQFQAT